MTELGHRFDGGQRPGDTGTAAGPLSAVDRADLLRARQLVLGRLSHPDVDDLTVQLAAVMADTPAVLGPLVARLGVTAARPGAGLGTVRTPEVEPGAAPDPAAAPDGELPVEQAPVGDAVESVAPETEAPETEAPETEAPETATPDAELSVAEASAASAPVAEAPVAEVPVAEVPVEQPSGEGAEGPVEPAAAAPVAAPVGSVPDLAQPPAEPGESAGPAVELTEPAVELTKPAVELTKPAVESTEQAGPVDLVRPTDEPAEPAAPAVESAEPAAASDPAGAPVEQADPSAAPADRPLPGARAEPGFGPPTLADEPEPIGWPEPLDPLTDPFPQLPFVGAGADLFGGSVGTGEEADSPTRLLPALRDAVFGRRRSPNAGMWASPPQPAGSEAAAPASVGPDALTPEALASEAAVSEAATRESAVPEAAVLDAATPAAADLEAVVSESIAALETGGPGPETVPNGAPRSGAARTDLPASTPSGVDARWTAELERAARVGRWSFELATGRLHRSPTLVELYASVGLGPDLLADYAPEQEQVRALDTATGAVRRQHHLALPLPDGGSLSCHAEIESDTDGAPLRVLGLVRDLSPEQVSGRRLGQSGQRFVDLMRLMPGGVALFDTDGRLVDANQGMCELLDLPLERLRGIPAVSMCAASGAHYPDALGPIDDGPSPLPEWLREAQRDAPHGYRVDDVTLQRSDGTPVWCELGVTMTTGADDERLWLVVCTDMTERRRAADLLRKVGSVDELTRLPNRAASVELVDGLLAGPGRGRVALVCGDIDDFARVNSSLGYEAGDDLLITLAGRLQRELPVGCTAARLSGDEFLVICADHLEVGGPDALARTVADLMSTTITVFGRPVQLTASVGLAHAVPNEERHAADLLRYAEAAMHDAKRRQSRGGIGIATDGVVHSAVHALELEAELRAAIAGDALELEFQPVVSADGTVLSAEALVRWPHPTRGLIAPSEFLPVAQRSGLLRELDVWVLHTAIRDAAGWPEHQGHLPSVAVNLAGLLPADVDFLPVVSEILRGSGLAPNRLVLELVETSLVELPPYARASMSELAERGVRFAVDDFGTGYSSLSRLKELPAHTVKVDRAFVTDVATDPVDFAVARAVVDMARAMGRTTVAEGVETAEQFTRLRGIGVDAFQGWLFAKALASADLRQMLSGDRLATPQDGPAGL